MDEQSFEQLAEQAASGLKADREIYLDVKQELRSHMEEKAGHFEAEGHTPEESADLSKKAFGSPLDVAADLLDANRRRMKLRSLMRIGSGALVVPLAVLLALYLGYGRVAHFVGMGIIQSIYPTEPERVPHLPMLPFYGPDQDKSRKGMELVRQLAGGEENAGNIRRYWAAHRDDSDSYMYYAYYAIFLDKGNTDERTFVDAMRLGERIEPQNALYNVRLAEYFLEKGMYARGEKFHVENDKMLDRRYFESGVSELRKAAGKPYLRAYNMPILRKKLNFLPPPLFLEDYISLISVSACELFPNLTRYRNVARKIPGCARILLSEGRSTEASEVMDTWKPYTKLLLSEPGGTLIHSLVAVAVGVILSKQAPAIYDTLGEYGKAREARALYRKLLGVRKQWKNEGSKKERVEFAETLRQHASVSTRIFFPVLGGGSMVAEQEFTPGRMADHVMAEELFTYILMSVLILLLLGTLLQGAIWHYRLRRAASVPLLLMPPAKEILRALLLGIVLPMAVYWVYSRLPGIGGREFGWSSEMKTRFIRELCVLGIIMLWLPAHIIRGYIRRRCTELDIELPRRKEEFFAGWKVKGAALTALIFASIAIFAPADTSPVLRTCLAIAIIALMYRYARGEHGGYGLYYGTLAKSLAPVYAIAVIFITLTVQPWLLYNEAHWLRQDKLIYGYMANAHNIGAFTAPEAKSAQRLNELIRKALDGK